VRERARQAAYSGPGTHGASIDLDVLLSPPFTTKSTDSRTHAKQSGGLLDSDKLIAYTTAKRECSAGGAEGGPRSKRQRGVRPANNTSFRKVTTGKTTASNCTSRQQVSVCTHPKRRSLIGASQCLVAARSKSSPTSNLRTHPRASNKRPPFDSQWVSPVGGAPSRHTSTWELGGACNWGTQARPSGAPTQAAGQAAEAMPSRPRSRGDARATERARTGGAKIALWRGQRISTPLEKGAHGLRSRGIGSST
jgi:hypothetical protein